MAAGRPPWVRGGGLTLARVPRLAGAHPHVGLGELDATVARHVDVLRGLDAEFVVFPELSLTGYDMGVSAVDPGDERAARRRVCSGP